MLTNFKNKLKIDIN